jgi:hypothetical protein
METSDKRLITGVKQKRQGRAIFSPGARVRRVPDKKVGQDTKSPVTSPKEGRNASAHADGVPIVNQFDKFSGISSSRRTCFAAP